jgi:hypothetical protein
MEIGAPVTRRSRPGNPIPEITVITQDPDNRLAEYFRGNVRWHIDGAWGRVMSPKAPAMCMHGVMLWSSRVANRGSK